MNFPILSSLILLPAVGALFLFFTRSNQENSITVKYVALFTSLVNFFLSIYRGLFVRLVCVCVFVCVVCVCVCVCVCV